jgi:pyrimidine deaminase RibD-like protein
MNKNKYREKSHEALVCGHCGEKHRMYVLATVKDTTEYSDEQGPSYESGTMYQVQSCPSCHKVVLVSGDWNDGMESEEEFLPQVLLPESSDLNARKVYKQHQLDRECMELAVSEARKCVSEDKYDPKVGAVVTLGGKILQSGYRGELAPNDHAEFTVLEKKCKDVALAGATVYTTLEPCTTRGPSKIPCANRLMKRKVSRVVIGMLDPDERIRGIGILALRKANIRVDLFPPDLMSKLEEMNHEFITNRESSAKETPKILEK